MTDFLKKYYLQFKDGAFILEGEYGHESQMIGGIKMTTNAVRYKTVLKVERQKLIDIWNFLKDQGEKCYNRASYSILWNILKDYGVDQDEIETVLIPDNPWMIDCVSDGNIYVCHNGVGGFEYIKDSGYTTNIFNTAFATVPELNIIKKHILKESDSNGIDHKTLSFLIELTKYFDTEMVGDDYDKQRVIKKSKDIIKRYFPNFK